MTALILRAMPLVEIVVPKLRTIYQRFLHALDAFRSIVHSGATIHSDLVGYPTDGYWTTSAARRGKIPPVKEQEISHA
jgi:hypothetical protein